MGRDPAYLMDVAERIAATENRIARLRMRVDRLTQEGSDASQAQELLELMRSNLSQLYSRQSNLRRSTWVADRPTG